MERTRGWVLFCFCNGRIPKPLHAASLQPPLFPAPQRSHVKRRRQTALLAGDGMMPLCRPSRVLAEQAWDQNSREKWPGREHGEQLCALREHESCKLPQHSSTLHGRLNLLNRVYKTRERFFLSGKCYFPITSYNFCQPLQCHNLVPIMHLKTTCWQKAVSFPYPIFAHQTIATGSSALQQRGFAYALNLQVSIYKVLYSSVIYLSAPISAVERILYTCIYLLDRLRQVGFGEKCCFSKQPQTKPQANSRHQIQFPPFASLSSIIITFCLKACGFRLQQDLLKAT